MLQQLHRIIQETNLERIKKLSLSSKKYPSEKDDLRKIEANYSTTAHNILHEKEMEFFPVYISKHNSQFWGIVMPSQRDYILQLDQYIKSDNMPHINYADILIKKIDRCAKNPEKSSTIGVHIPRGYLMSTI